MFIVYEDMSISLNRGDVGVIPVPQSKDGDYGYSISAGDVLRIRVFPKKKCEEVALVKDFLVETATSVIELELDGTDTKIGDIINKPTTYWYEIELNPDTYPQTIVGYNEDGPKVFMLYPEGDDSGELPSINTGKPVTVSDEAVKSIINNEIFKEILKNAIIAIDQKYDSESKNAQSGIAVAEAIKGLRQVVSGWMEYMETEIVVPGDEEVKDYVDDALIVDDFDVGLKFEDYNLYKCFVITNDGGNSFDGVMSSEIVVTNRNKMPVSKGTRIIPGDSCVIQGFAAFDENNKFLSYNSRALDGSDIYGDSDIFSYETFDQLTVEWDGYIMISIRFTDTSIESLTDEQFNELVSGVKFFKTLNLKEYIDETLKNFQGGSGGVTDEQLAEIVAEYLANNPVVTVDDALSETSTNPVQNKVIYATLDALIADFSKSLESSNSSLTSEMVKYANTTFVAKEDGKGLSANDFTDEYKEKLDNVTTGSDGVSATHSWDGTVLTITSASGTSSADLKGDKGDTGSQGIQGEKGEQGIQGEAGADGKDYDYVESYVKTEAESVIERVIEAQNGRTFTFACISDIHYGMNSYTDGIKHAAQALKYIDSRVKLDAFMVLGDYSDKGSLAEEYEGAVQDFMDVNNLFNPLRFTQNLRLQGNHDFDYEHSPRLYRYIQGYSDNVVWGSQLGGYFYKDFEGHKVRVICLNTTEEASDCLACSDEQYQWFINSLDLSNKEDSAEWQTLIVSHIPIDWYENGKPCLFYQIIDAYQKGTTWSYEGLTCDYSGKNSARLIANIHGHIHNLLIKKVIAGYPTSTDTIDLYRISTPNASDTPENSKNGWLDTNPYGEDVSYSKTQNTAQDTAFCVYCIDLDTFTIKSICYGAGYDRELNYESGTVTETYSVQNILTNVTNSNTTKNVNVGDSYSAELTSSGTITSVIITMGGVDITSTAYSNGIITIEEVTGNVVITAVADTKSYTNLISTAVDTDGTTIFNGVGYKADTRLSGSSGAMSSVTGVYSTGWIPYTLKQGDIIRLKNITLDETFGYACFLFFKSVGSAATQTAKYSTLESYGYSPVFDDNGNVTQITIGVDDTFTHFAVNASLIDETSIITVNEEIIE